MDYLIGRNVNCTEVKEVNKKRKTITKLRENPVEYEQYKVNERHRQLQNKENKADEVEEAGQCS